MFNPRHKREKEKRAQSGAKKKHRTDAREEVCKEEKKAECERLWRGSFNRDSQYIRLTTKKM